MPLRRKNGKISQHLQFLGYETVKIEDSISADHPDHGTINLVGQSWGGIVHSIHWATGNERVENEQAALRVNEENRSTDVGCFFIDNEGDLRLYAVYCGAYSKVTYGRFLGKFQQEKSRAEKVGGVVRSFKLGS